MSGKAYWVCVGEKDSMLVTLKALEAMRRADLIVHDLPAGSPLLHMMPNSSKITVFPDDEKELVRIFTDAAEKGLTAVRIKREEPASYQYLLREAEIWNELELEYEWIPGVSPMLTAPLYAGIPLAYTDQPIALWQEAEPSPGTYTYYVSAENVQACIRHIQQSGITLDTPAAVIWKGTTGKQKVMEAAVGKLERLFETVLVDELSPHSKSRFNSSSDFYALSVVIVIGKAVNHRERLSWLEQQPLYGKRILITRAPHQSADFSQQIAEHGGEAVEFPVIEIRQPSELELIKAMDHILHTLKSYDWIIFTSVNGVDYFFQRMLDISVDVRTMHRASIAAVGPKTANALQQRGIVPVELPKQFQAEQLLEVIGPQMSAGQRVLLPRGNIAREIVPEKLREMGMDVTEMIVYENVPAHAEAGRLRSMLESGRIDYVTFTSPSTVHNFMAILQTDADFAPAHIPEETQIVCIGPVTAQAALEEGLRVDRIAEQATVPSLLLSILET